MTSRLKKNIHKHDSLTKLFIITLQFFVTYLKATKQYTKYLIIVASVLCMLTNRKTYIHGHVYLMLQCTSSVQTEVLMNILTYGQHNCTGNWYTNYF